MHSLSLPAGADEPDGIPRPRAEHAVYVTTPDDNEATIALNAGTARVRHLQG